MGELYNPYTLGIITRTASTRTLNSAAFTPSTTNVVRVSYSVRIQAALSLAGGQSGFVQLLINGVEACRTRNGQTGTLIIGLAVNGDSTAVLSEIINPGDTVQLVTNNTTGTPTFSIEAQNEAILKTN